MKEEEIRPQHVFDEYLRLAEQDTRKYFESDDRAPVNCPACDAKGSYTFTKHGFAYEECEACQTLFVSPRPPAAAFARYYQESDSVRYWASTFYKATAEARREKLWKPKAAMIQQLVLRFASLEHRLVDIGGGYGIFAEEYERISGQRVLVIEPGPELASVCREKRLDVLEAFMEDVSPSQLGDPPRAFVSFELFEHLHDPRAFLRHVYDLMRPGDLFLFTTLSGTGVDIQALWEDSKSVSPPHHLNFLNPKSIRRLLEDVGYDVLETSTPGKLDIDILCSNASHIKDRFWRTFVAQATEEERGAMQAFIAENGLSSHMLIVCRKTAAVAVA